MRIGVFLLRGFLVIQRRHPMNSAQIETRIGSNLNHHLWNNHRTWWVHYTEHLCDYTKRRVRRSLHTQNLNASRAMRDVLFSEGFFQKASGRSFLREAA